MTATLEIPDSLALSWPRADTDMARVILENFAVEAYRQGNLTPLEVRQMLGHSSRWETEAFLSSHGAWPDTSREDLEEGIRHLQQFPRPAAG